MDWKEFDNRPLIEFIKLIQNFISKNYFNSKIEKFRVTYFY